MMRTRATLIAIVAAVAVLGAGCTSSTTESTVTTAATTTIPSEMPDLEFGNGEVPFSVPEGFPLPETAVVGSTMMDGVNGRTEMNVNFPATVLDVVAYYETNLPVLGFLVVESTGNDTEWGIILTKDDTTGTIRLIFGGTGLTAGTIAFDHA